MESYPEKAKARPIDLQTYGGRVFLEVIPFYFTVKCLTEVRDSGFWEDGKIITEEEEKFKASKASRKQELPFGIWLEALNKGDPIEVRISFSLHDKHRPNEALELGCAQTFEQTTISAADRWDSILGKIDVKGRTDEMRVISGVSLPRRNR